MGKAGLATAQRPGKRAREEIGRRRLLRVSQVAEWLGMDVKGVRKLAEDRALALVRLGGPRGVRFRPEDVEAYIKSHRVASVVE